MKKLNNYTNQNRLLMKQDIKLQIALRKKIIQALKWRNLLFSTQQNI